MVFDCSTCRSLSWRTPLMVTCNACFCMDGGRDFFKNLRSGCSSPRTQPRASVRVVVSAIFRRFAAVSFSMAQRSLRLSRQNVRRSRSPRIKGGSDDHTEHREANRVSGDEFVGRSPRVDGLAPAPKVPRNKQDEPCDDTCVSQSTSRRALGGNPPQQWGKAEIVIPCHRATQ